MLTAGPHQRRFVGLHRLAELRRETEAAWERIAALILPTAPEHPTHIEVAADPVGVNALLGTFTNFVNLFDLAAVAVRAPARDDGLPFGITLMAPAWSDGALLRLATAFEAGSVEAVGHAEMVSAHA